MTDLAPSPAATALTDLARRHPSRVVVADLDRRLTAAELERGAAAVAAAVMARAASAGPNDETWVPVYVDRSVESIIAFQGLVRSGRPFALIDPTLPPAAIAALHQRMGHPDMAVVPRADFVGVAPPGTEVLTVTGLEGSGEQCDPQPVDPAAAAMIIFTSGSTGQPKGVMRAWSSFERIVADQTLLRPGHVLIGAQYATFRPLHFAAAGNPMVAAALGSTIHVLDPGRVGIEGLLAEIQERRLDSIDGATSLMWALVRAAEGERLLPLVTKVTFGGDPTPWELVAAIRKVVSPEARMVTRYGATETGGFVHFEVTPSTPIGIGDLPIGVPSDAGRVRLAPIEPGSSLTQIVIRDPDAVGYLGDPAMTAERFSVDANGARWWVSGDVAVVDEDGVYHYRGRVDDIVKINGVMVSPLGSELALRETPGVAEVVVLPDRTASGRARLVAHLRVDDPSLTARQLRDQLLHVIPGPLVPSVFVRHDQLPLTVNGKVDRRALLAAPLQPWGAAPRRWPADEVERVVTGLCRELLEQPELGPDDDLWLMGLDSLGAVELCAMVTGEGLGDLDPRRLLGVATASEVAHHLRARRDVDVERDSDLVVLNGAGTLPPVFGMPGAGQTALAMVALARALGPDQPVVVAEPFGLHTRGRPDRSVEAIAARARREIEAFLGDRSGEEIVVFGHSAGATTAYELAQQRHDAGHRTRVVLIDGVPRVDGRVPAAPLIADRPDATNAASRSRLAGRFLELPAIAWRQALIARYQRFPGPPRVSVERYVGFYRRFVPLLKRYRPQPARFPCTLVHVVGSGTPEAARHLVADLETRQVGGGHRTCMDHPHVVDIAAVIREELDRIAR